MFRRCKECGHAGLYNPSATGTKARGFHGHVCYACYLEEQRSWRGTELGRQQANEASRASALRKRTKPTAPRDV